MRLWVFGELLIAICQLLERRIFAASCYYYSE
jgi:hypothetical protein